MSRKISSRKKEEDLDKKRESSKIIFKEALSSGLSIELDVAERYSVEISGRSGLLDETILLGEFESACGGYQRPSYGDIQELIAVLQGGLEALDELEDQWNGPSE